MISRRGFLTSLALLPVVVKAEPDRLVCRGVGPGGLDFTGSGGIRRSAIIGDITVREPLRTEQAVLWPAGVRGDARLHV